MKEDVRIDILKQYYPTWQAYKFPETNRRLTTKEYQEVVNYAKKVV